MKIIVGHTNMDLDSIGSIILARYLFPDHVPVKSHLVHPVARNLLNLFEDTLAFTGVAELKGKPLEHVVVVDTRSPERIAEYLRGTENNDISFEIFDHHPSEGKDIAGATLHECFFGSNTTQLALELVKRGIQLSPEAATIALTGIYADTGNFTHDNVAPEDFEAAAFLLDQGASLKLVKEFLVPLKEKQQIVLFHEILNQLEKRVIRGHQVQTCYMELEEDTQGLGAVIEQVFAVENGELLFGFFFFRPKSKMLIIARNSNKNVGLNEILSGFGGGGHRQAASATVKTDEGRALADRILEYLTEMLAPAVTAREIMSTRVVSARANISLMEASKIMEVNSHSSLPVVDDQGHVLGLLTLRDIMNGRKGGQMHVCVRQFMSKPAICATPDTTLREIDEILFENNIGHLPICENGILVGIVTRYDYLRYQRDDRLHKDSLIGELGIAEAV